MSVDSPPQAAISAEVTARETTARTAVGKASAENFPVASRLLPRSLRAPIITFYAFARSADDIADDPVLAPEEKLRCLDAFAAALNGPEPEGGPEVAVVRALARCLRERGLGPQHGLSLLEAFRQDVKQTRYTDWAALMGYCRLSAAPVGRQVLDFAGEGPAIYPSSDALCNALQVLNHIQDMGADYRRLGRVYLPQDWFAAAGATEAMLTRPKLAPALRQVVDCCLDETDALLTLSRRLPEELGSVRLAAECAAIQALAEALSRRLRREDPLAGRVALGPMAKLRVGLAGALAGYRRHCRRASLPAEVRP